MLAEEHQRAPRHQPCQAAAHCADTAVRAFGPHRHEERDHVEVQQEVREEDRVEIAAVEPVPDQAAQLDVEPAEIHRAVEEREDHHAADAGPERTPAPYGPEEAGIQLVPCEQEAEVERKEVDRLPCEDVEVDADVDRRADVSQETFDRALRVIWNARLGEDPGNGAQNEDPLGVPLGERQQRERCQQHHPEVKREDAEMHRAGHETERGQREGDRLGHVLSQDARLETPVGQCQRNGGKAEDHRGLVGVDRLHASEDAADHAAHALAVHALGVDQRHHEARDEDEALRVFHEPESVVIPASEDGAELARGVGDHHEQQEEPAESVEYGQAHGSLR